MKRFLIVFLVVICLGVMLGCSGGQVDNTTNTDPTVGTEVTEEPTQVVDPFVNETRQNPFCWLSGLGSFGNEEHSIHTEVFEDVCYIVVDDVYLFEVDKTTEYISDGSSFVVFEDGEKSFTITLTDVLTIIDEIYDTYSGDYTYVSDRWYNVSLDTLMSMSLEGVLPDNQNNLGDYLGYDYVTTVVEEITTKVQFKNFVGDGSNLEIAEIKRGDGSVQSFVIKYLGEESKKASDYVCSFISYRVCGDVDYSKYNDIINVITSSDGDGSIITIVNMT